ncbi:MAG: hypothetical protein HY905_28040 [Deltaproteobacteria bacterium]|nr:hypothetical protein [Deltaproteobacteria bacterium]
MFLKHASRLCRSVPEAGRRVLAGLLVERLGDSPVLARFKSRDGGDEPLGPRVSPYEAHRAEITAAYRELGGSLSALEAAFQKRGIALHRRWLAEFLERWGVRKRRPRARVGGR